MLQVESTFIGFIKYESTLYKIDDRTYYKYSLDLSQCGLLRGSYAFGKGSNSV